MTVVVTSVSKFFHRSDDNQNSTITIWGGTVDGGNPAAPGMSKTR